MYNAILNSTISINFIFNHHDDMAYMYIRYLDDKLRFLIMPVYTRYIYFIIEARKMLPKRRTRLLFIYLFYLIN